MPVTLSAGVLTSAGLAIALMVGLGGNLECGPMIPFRQFR